MLRWALRTVSVREDRGTRRAETHPSGTGEVAARCGTGATESPGGLFGEGLHVVVRHTTEFDALTKRAREASRNVRSIGACASHGNVGRGLVRILLSNSLRHGGLSGCLGGSLLRRLHTGLFRSFLGGLLGRTFLGGARLGSFERPPTLRSLGNRKPASGTNLPLWFCGLRPVR